MRYLVTGHTGFKGSWLTLMLANRGHEVIGVALDPEPGGLYTAAGVADAVVEDVRLDIRDAPALLDVVTDAAPDVVLHLAAQPLVRASYADPTGTVTANVIGTMNLLEAVRVTPTIRAQVIVTTDKVYRNVDRVAGYAEDEPLGGAADPYSASKAMADLLTQSWVHSFALPPTGIARAGNVIGGGDVSRDRLLPDLLSGYASGAAVPIRYPSATRPWQHVLDCLRGYLALVDALLDGRGAGEWNFGPGTESFVSVARVADLTAALWGSGASWRTTDGSEPPEANMLALDASKAASQLDWSNKLRFPLSLEWTVAWEKAVRDGGSPREITEQQIAEFLRIGSDEGPARA